MQTWRWTELLQMLEVGPSLAAMQAVKRLVKFATALFMCFYFSRFSCMYMYVIKVEKYLLSPKCTYSQRIFQAVVTVVVRGTEFKIVNYQQNFAPHWCGDVIIPAEIERDMIFRIVGRSNCADNVSENLHVWIYRKTYNGNMNYTTMAAASSPQRVRYTVINVHASLFSIVVSFPPPAPCLEKRMAVPNGELRRGAHFLYVMSLEPVGG